MQREIVFTQQDLKKLGLDEVAYLKAYKDKGGVSWVLHAADGTALAVQKDAAAAVASARHQDLNLVTLH